MSHNARSTIPLNKSLAFKKASPKFSRIKLSILRVGQKDNLNLVHTKSPHLGHKSLLYLFLIELPYFYNHSQFDSLFVTPWHFWGFVMYFMKFVFLLKMIEKILCLPWKSGLEDIKLGLSKSHSKDSEILCPPSIALDKEALLHYFEEIGFNLCEIKPKGSR